MKYFTWDYAMMLPGQKRTKYFLGMCHFCTETVFVTVSKPVSCVNVEREKMRQVLWGIRSEVFLNILNVYWTMIWRKRNVKIKLSVSFT